MPRRALPGPRLAHLAVLAATLSFAVGCARALPSAGPSPTAQPSPSAQPAAATPTPGAAPQAAPEATYPVRYYHGAQPVSYEPPPGWQVTELGEEGPLASAVRPGGRTTIELVSSAASGDASQSNRRFVQAWLEGTPIEADVDAAYTFADGVKGWVRAGRTVPPAGGGPSERWRAVTLSAGSAAYHLAIRAEPGAYDLAAAAFEAAAKSLRLEPTGPIEVPRDSALVLNSGEPDTLDPALTHSGADGLIGDLFSGLVVLDPGMQVRPALAESWDIEPGGSLYTFHLNPRARFHNGRPVTAEDVRYSWERAASPKTGSETVLLYMGDILGLAEFHAGRAEAIAGIKVLDAHTLQVTLDGPKPYFLAKLTYPVSWVVDRDDMALPNWQLHPNGTGPFRHLQHVKDLVFVLERNPDYYGQAPALAHIVYRMYAGYSQQLYEDGEIDYTGVSRDQLSRVADPSDGLHGTLVTETGLCTQYVTFNTLIPPFDDRLVRRAFALAVDRRRYVEAISNGEDLPGRGALPPGMPGYSDALRPLPYDPQEARRLLSQSSYASRPLPPIVWTVPTSGGRAPASASLLIDMWQETLGVQVSLEGVDWNSYSQALDHGQYGQLLIEGWCADYPDPENFLDVLFHSLSPQNHAHYQSPEYDALIEQARTLRDGAERLALYQQAEQRLVDDAPAVFLSYPGPGYSVWKPYVRGYIPSPIGVPQHQALWLQH